MAIKIRLKRIGRRNRPFYRAVVLDSRKRRDGAAIEELGWYNPILKEQENYSLKEDRILHWLKEGAQVSDTVHTLLKRSGLAMRWHLMKQGLDEKAIEKEMQKWALKKKESKKQKTEKKAPEASVESVKEPEPESAKVAETSVEEPATEEKAVAPEEEPATEAETKPADEQASEESEIEESKNSEPAEPAAEDKKTEGDDTPSVQEESNNETTEEASAKPEEVSSKDE